MACNEGTDPADFAPGAVDPADDPGTPDPDVFFSAVEMLNNPTPRQARFQVGLSNPHDDDVLVDYATINGLAIAGTHYVAKTGTLTIPAGETDVSIYVNIIEAPNISGNIYFSMGLSNPVNAVLLADEDEILIWVTFPRPGSPPPDDGGGGGGGGSTGSYVGFTKPGVVYDQFLDCHYKYACTAAASGAAMSGLYQHATGQNKSFDWKKLYRDAGGCLAGCSDSCNGENWLTMLRRMRDVGIKDANSSTFYKAGFTELSRTVTKTQLIANIKDAIRDNGILYLASPWYSSPNRGWNRCLSCNSFVLRNPEGSGPFGADNSSCAWTGSDLTSNPTFGHTWIFTGWNNNKANGAFEIQSSHGRDWGSDGRGWMPYSYLGLSGRWHYFRMTYRGPA